MDPNSIKQRILQAIPDSQVSVESDDGVHYSARVVAAAFAGLGRLQRHRLVHEAVGAELGRQIHALSLELKSPDELDD